MKMAHELGAKVGLNLGSSGIVRSQRLGSYEDVQQKSPFFQNRRFRFCLFVALEIIG